MQTLLSSMAVFIIRGQSKVLHFAHNLSQLCVKNDEEFLHTWAERDSLYCRFLGAG